jgi:hypothetical protein
MLTLALVALFISSQMAVSNALGGRGPDVKVPSITVVPGAVTNLVKKAIRGVHRVNLNTTSISVPAGSNGACSGGASGSWDEGFGMQWQYRTDGTKISYHRATATHYCGSRGYQHEAHGTLIHGWDPNTDAVWSNFNNPCDEVVKNNDPEVATCSSPDFNSHHGDKWFVISGHYFDQDFNGTHTWECEGCMDTKWTMP